MHIDSMQVSQLRLIHEIALSGSLTQAAERVGITQPAASHALARLRRQLNDQIFVRTSSGMRATPYGEQLSASIRDALQALNGAFESRAEFAPATSRRSFNLFIGDNGQLVILPRLLARLNAVAPHARLRAQAFPPKGLHVSLESGEVDLAVGSFTTLVAGFKQKRLFRESYVCVVRRDHPLFKNGMSLEAFRAVPHAMAEEAGLAHERLERWLNKQNLERDVKLCVPRFMVLSIVATNSDLLVIMPSRVADQFSKILPLKVMQAPLKLPTYDIKLFWHERVNDEPANRWLRSVLVELFADASPAAA